MDPVATKRLVLRDFRMEDWKAVHEYASDPQVVTHLPWGPNSTDQTLDFVRRAIDESARPNRRRFELAVELTGEERVIGGARITASGTDNRDADMGYVVHRKYWNRGIATEAAAALVEFGFRQLGLHRIWATCDVDNPASARVLEKIGMIREGRIRQNQWRRGDWRDQFLFAILYPEWKLAREASL